jgi:hypothetical protein
MITLIRMMIDGRAQILQIAPSATLPATLFRIAPTLLAVHLHKHLGAPPVVEAANPFLEFANASDAVFGLLADFETVPQHVQLRVEIDGQYVADRNYLDVLSLPFRLILRNNIFLQLLFCGRNFICSAACADIPARPLSRMIQVALWVMFPASSRRGALS